ncbi:MAG: cyclic nucleotide-binding domain-containing protein [Bryobacteraceae bacterium]
MAQGLGDITLLSVLRSHAFVSGLSESQVERLAGLASEAVFPEDEVILLAGQRSTSFYLLVEGSVAVELRTPRYSVCVQALGPGQVFGWSALLDRQEAHFQVRARERTRALRLDGAALAAACQRDPQLGAEVFRRALEVVAGRVKATELRFAEMCGVRV